MSHAFAPCILGLCAARPDDLDELRHQCELSWNSSACRGAQGGEKWQAGRRILHGASMAGALVVLSACAHWRPLAGAAASHACPTPCPPFLLWLLLRDSCQRPYSPRARLVLGWRYRSLRGSLLLAARRCSCGLSTGRLSMTPAMPLVMLHPRSVVAHLAEQHALDHCVIQQLPFLWWPHPKCCRA